MKNKLEKRKLFFFILSFLFFSNSLFSHTLLLEEFDNEDETMEVIGSFSTGARAEGALLRIESLSSASILFEKRLPESSSLIIPIPKEAYLLVLDGGPGHQVVLEGKIQPKGGFSVSTTKKENKELSKNRSSSQEWSTAYIVILSIAFLLIFLTLYISSKNTTKLMLMIQDNKRV